MVENVIGKSGFPMGLDFDGLADRFAAHNQAVQNFIPAEQLLVYQVKEGWAPLCKFLNVAAPTTEFPRTNNREEFGNLVKSSTA